MTIVKRDGLGRPLTWSELDGNFDTVEQLRTEAAQSVAQSGANANAAAASAEIAQDAQTAAIDAAEVALAAVTGTLRVPENVISTLPNVAGRSGLAIRFDDDGNPEMYDPDQFKVLINSNAGAAEVGTSSGKTVQEEINTLHALNPIYAVDYLPEGYVTDGSVSYTTQIQAAVNAGAISSRKVVMPNFQVLISPVGTAWGGVDIPSNSHIVFNINSSVKIEPNSLTNYELFSLRDVSNVQIDNATLIGDKYTHTGTAGEFGMCLAIRGACANIKINYPVIFNAWGDGIYIGQIATTVASTPHNLIIESPVIKFCRRQGISVTSANGLLINNPVISDTKSSDAPTPLPAGPHAGIDIEPNSFLSELRGIRINNLRGARNDGGLFYTFLSSVENSFVSGNRYPVEITVDGVTDSGSSSAVSLTGLSTNAQYSGAIYINNVTSNIAQRNGLRCRNWADGSRLPVFVNGITINNWNDGAFTSELDKSAIAIYQSGDSAYPAIGSMTIKGISLSATQSAGVVAESLVFTQNSGIGGIKNVSIDIDNVFTNNATNFIQSQAGNIEFLNRGNFGQYVRWVRGSSFTHTLSIQADYDIYQPTVTPTVTLPTVQAPLFVGHKSRFKFTSGGTGVNFRIRSTVIPFFVNGIAGSNFLFNQNSGVIDLTYDGVSFYGTCKGEYTKES